VLTDGTATFSVTAAGPGLTYRRRRNGVAIAGATSATYATGPIDWADSGAQFTVVVSNTDGQVTSNSALLELALSADQQAFEALTLGPQTLLQSAPANLTLSGTLSSAAQYRVYFELNGNVYTGALIQDGTLLGGSYYISNPGGATVTERLTFLPFQIRMNKAARDSVAAAMAI